MSNDKSAATWAGMTPEELAQYAEKDAGWRPPLETTGEHIQHKLADDLYQDFVNPKDVPEHHMEIPQMTDAEVDRLYEAVTHRGPKRGWTPTVGELGLSLGIVVTIIVVFVFIVFAYPGW